LRLRLSDKKLSRKKSVVKKNSSDSSKKDFVKSKKKDFALKRRKDSDKKSSRDSVLSKNN
tara:strand:+ start:1760 stop:1939 length:180 start_codon:yes stop_codon:yes gene_type:complete